MGKHIKFLLHNMKYIGHPPWDTGVSPPELICFIEHHLPGNALDLGCGTGTNMHTLLNAGWQVDGVEYALIAVMKARKKINRFHNSGHVFLENVVHLDHLQKYYDLILDIGCYHSLSATGKTLYHRNIDRLLNINGVLLMYSFLKAPDHEVGIDANEINEFQKFLTLRSRKDGSDKGNKLSTWLEFRKEH